MGFINPDDIDDWGWKWKGESLSVSTILAWSNMWSSTMVPMIPVFEHTERIDQADIRVKFSSNLESLSMYINCTVHVIDHVLEDSMFEIMT